MTKPPPVRYAPTSDGGYIAYQVIGEHDTTIAYLGGMASNLEGWWDYEPAAAYLRGWGAFSRFVLHDRRGTGLSDAGGGLPNLETRVSDLVAVLDDAGVDRVALYGVYDGGMVAALFAATYPERTSALIWWSPTGRVAAAPDYPWGATPDEIDEVAEIMATTWGSEAHSAASLRHSGVDPELIPGLAAFTARMNRLACGPATARAFYRIMAESDVRATLPTVRVPTLLIDRASFDDRERAEAEDVAARIPHASLLRLPAGPKSTLVDPEPIYAATRDLLGIERPRVEADAVLATVLFTDIVDSTRLQASLGDAGWRSLAERHHAAIRQHLAAFHGTEQDTAGDGFFARFDGPARAIRCALEAISDVARLGIAIRAGVHTGECEIVDGKCGGLTVSIGARVMARAEGSVVLVTQTVKDLCAGSGFRFEDAGEHELKGVPDRWRLYRVSD
ncbi:MAG TPA: adenylate/guanylate cyclase domain-containing protein [Actinomycetota bacterium]|nr:adenylate/guanylate cyclase domain-containing protein [Actinomycetota bacterium]